MGLKFWVDEEFFTRWRPSMAYVLGYIFADGSLEDAQYLRGKYLRITSTDYDILDRIKSALQAAHPLVRVEAIGARKTRYLLRIGSKKIFHDLNLLRVYTRKSLTMRLPPIPAKYFPHFLRGYFDGDGCVHVERPKGILKVIFTSGSERFLLELARAIHVRVGVSHRRVVDSHRSFQLRYGQREGLDLLGYLYRDITSGLFLERKRSIYQNFIGSRRAR